jgi:hypothetical protein
MFRGDPGFGKPDPPAPDDNKQSVLILYGDADFTDAQYAAA